MKYFATLPFITNEVSNKAMLAVATPHGRRQATFARMNSLRHLPIGTPHYFSISPGKNGERKTAPCFAHCFWLILPLSRSLI